MQSEIPEEIMMHAERLYDEGGYKTVPQIIAEAIMAERAALEAALSAAEPQPAPSVAVKALEWKPVVEGGRDVEAVTEFGKYTISIDSSFAGGTHYLWTPDQKEYDDEHHSEHRGMTSAHNTAKADYEARIRSARAAQGTELNVETLCRSPIIEGLTPTTEQWDHCETIQDRYDLMKRLVRSALSAQVQDVAGWRPIETAPKDGTPVILWTVWLGDEISPDPFSEVQIGYWDPGNGLPESHDFSRRPEWVVQRIGEPTHWMPLPAAPAKQEGGHD